MIERIEREVSVPAPAEAVWDAVVGDGWLADEVCFDLRPGGDADFHWADEQKHGWVEDVCAPSDATAGTGRLAFWWAAGEEPATRVEVTIIPESREMPRVTVRIVETRPLDRLDLIGTPLHGMGGRSYGPALVAA